MNHAKLLDCTLRDGAYLIDKEFGDKYIQGIIHGLVNSHIDCIEIGFFQDEGSGDGKTVFLNSADAKRFIPKDKNGCMFTVLADCSRYSLDNLDECTADSVDAVRECFLKEERFLALENCRKITEKGYKCFVQPVDILGYSDSELIEFIHLINEVDVYCLSIVDTFGSMYQEDLSRIFEIIDQNLVSTCKVGFHSHNNMQLSNALSQEFVRITYAKREIVVDCTLSGMGRGAGNTPTELIAQYMVAKQGYDYNIDSLLDLIDDYMDNIRARCSWGYTTPYFVAGCYGAHVNNITYLSGKNTIKSKDIRCIINQIGAVSRKRYHYDLLERAYLDYLTTEIDDNEAMSILNKTLADRDILLLVPGSSVVIEQDMIKRYIDKKDPVVIGINFIHERIPLDYIYISNIRRYSYWKNNDSYISQKKIIASNIKREAEDDLEYIISFNRLVQCGGQHNDNSTLMLLRLLDEFDTKSIGIAGFDGYSCLSGNTKNYATADLELFNVREDPNVLNEEIESMLEDYAKARKHDSEIVFVTESRFAGIFRTWKSADKTLY